MIMCRNERTLESLHVFLWVMSSQIRTAEPADRLWASASAAASVPLLMISMKKAEQMVLVMM